MVRRTISLPDSVDALIREVAQADESFSAAVTRLVQAGAEAQQAGKQPRYVASGEGPRDLGRKAEQYIRQLVVG